VSELNITSVKLTGAPGSSGWAQIHDFTPMDPEKLKLRGRLIAVITTNQGAEGVESVALGREVLARLQEEYFGETETGAFKRLQKAVEIVVKEFEPLGVEISAASFMGNILYVAVGGSQAAVFREGSMAKILSGQKREVSSASGYPKDGDYFLLGSNSFFEIPEIKLKSALQGKNPEEASEVLAPILHTRENGGGLAGALLYFSQKKEVVEEKTESKLKIKTPKILSSPRIDFFGKLKEMIPRRKLYIRRSEEMVEDVQKKRTSLTVGTVLILLLLVSVGFGSVQKREKAKKEVYKDKLVQATHELDEAVDLFTLNPERARELFVSSKEIANKLSGDGVEDDGLTELLARINQKEEEILKEYKVEPELFLDLSLFSENFVGDYLASSGETIFVLDSGGKKIISVLVKEKTTETVAGKSQIDSPKDLLSYETRAFILTQEGVVEVDDGGKKELVVEKDWVGDVVAYAYAGNIYMVEKSSSNIFRFPGAGEEFGSKQNWLAPGVDIDLSETKSMAIDGSIWVLTQTGKIVKLLNGNPKSFDVSSVFPPVVGAKALYTNEELSGLYVLDTDKRRIVVTDKDGNYLAQYFSDMVGEATDLMVSETEKKIILLMGEKLMSVEIRHL